MSTLRPTVLMIRASHCVLEAPENMRHSRLIAGGIALFLIAGATAPAAALDRRVRIVNESTHKIVEFYASNVDERAPGEDMLGDDDLPPGSSVVLNFDDGSGYCRFAFRAMFDDGVELVKKSVNICEIGTYRYTD